jgi:hypothetical protein
LLLHDVCMSRAIGGAGRGPFPLAWPFMAAGARGGRCRIARTGGAAGAAGACAGLVCAADAGGFLAGLTARRTAGAGTELDAVAGVGDWVWGGGWGRCNKVKLPFLNSSSRDRSFLLLPPPPSALPRPPLPPRPPRPRPLPPPCPCRSFWLSPESDDSSSACLRTGCVSRVRGTNFDGGDFRIVCSFRCGAGGLIWFDSTELMDLVRAMSKDPASSTVRLLIPPTSPAGGGRSGMRRDLTISSEDSVVPEASGPDVCSFDNPGGWLSIGGG